MVQPAVSTAEIKIPQLKGHVYTMLAAFAGVIFGVLGSLGFIGNYMQSQFASQTASLSKQIVNAAPAADYTACVAPTAGTGAATKNNHSAVTTAAVMPANQQVGGKGGDEPTHGSGSNAPFVSQLVNGSISDTGPDSTNTITAKNSYKYTVTNNNNVGVTNSSSQSASSGNANVSDNTNAGSANTGDASNQNSSSTNISINN